MSTSLRLASGLAVLAVFWIAAPGCLAAAASGAAPSALQRAEGAASSAAGAVDKAVVGAEKAVARGARKGGDAVARGVKAANRGADKLAAKAGLPPGSAPAGQAAGPQR